MEELSLAADLAVVLTAALLGGLAANRLRQPPILGYLIGGIVIGPYGLGLVHDLSQVQRLADMGVLLLMFALGVEFSFSELRRVGRIALLGTVLQIFATILWGALLGLWLGWSPTNALFFGSLIALSSTMILLKTLMDRGELDSLHGRLMIGFLIVQDIAVVPMMVLWPALAGAGSDWLLDTAVAMGKAAVFLVLMLAVGTRLVPFFMHRVAALRSRELFLLAIVVLVLVTAAGTSLFGLSLAFGAFVAGAVVSESDLNRQILGDVIPLRDIFATLFFVSIGMLVGPVFLMENLGTVVLVVAAILVGKFVVFSGLSSLFGYAGKVALLVGLGMGQIGEFSFVLAKMGVDRGIIPEYLYSLTLVCAIATILVTPLALASGPALIAFMGRNGRLRGWLDRGFHEKPSGRGLGLTNHAIICGYGRVGRNLITAFEQRNFSYVVVDYDPVVIANLRQRGVRCLYGDAGNAEVLREADLVRARVLVLTVSDPITTLSAAWLARKANPRVEIVARVHRDQDAARLRALGVTALVQPEFEASLEVVRHSLHRYGVSGVETQYILNRFREEHYSAAGS